MVEIDGYDGFELIGSGGNAHVYRATATDTQEVVAVKVITGGGDEAVARRFERERTLMSELHSIANVVPVHASGVLDTGDPFIVMPLYEGGSLEDGLERGRMPWKRAMELTKRLADSVALAHAKRILHLDIKPANVLLDEAGEPWLADFGIAEAMGPTVSMSAKMMTPAYTSPERIAGGSPSEQTDTYGVVATLFALLAGRQPYVTEKTTTAVAVGLAVQNDPLPIEWITDEVPESVRNLVLRGMAKDPSDRPRSAIELVGLMEDVLEGREVAPPVIRPSANQNAETIIEVDVPDESSGRSGFLKVLLPIGLVVVAVFAGVWALSGNGDGDDETSDVLAASITEDQTTEASSASTIAEVVASPPVASFESSATDVDQGATIFFRDTSAGEVTEVEWFTSDGQEAGGSTMTRDFPDPGRYIVEMTVTGPGGTDTASIEVFVEESGVTLEEPDPPPRPDNLGCQFVGEDEVWWVFSALPALVETYEIELSDGTRRDITPQPRPFVLDDGDLVRIIAVGEGGDATTTVGSCESHGGLSLDEGGPAVPTNIRCEFHDFFWRDGITWSETWSWDAGEGTDSFLLKYNQDGVDDFVEIGAVTTQTNADVNGGSNSGRSLKGIVPVGGDVQRELPIGNCGQMGGTGWPDQLPGPVQVDVSQRITIRTIGDTMLRFSFGPDVASEYTATISNASGVATTLTGEAQSGQLVDETVEGLEPGTVYQVDVALSGDTEVQLAPVTIRTSGGEPAEPATEQVTISEVDVVDVRSERFQLSYNSNICANASFEIRNLGGEVVGSNAGLEAGCGTSHHAVPGFWTEALESGTTYEVEIQVEADGAGLGNGNIATETLTVTTE